jgi:PAS domain S-box-containing protein
MNDQNKTKEELLLELKELTQKYDSLKATTEFEASERKRAGDIYRRAFHGSSDSISITERDGMYIDVNEGFTRITGYTREEVLGKLSPELNIWAIPGDLQKLIVALKERGFIENLESKFRCKDGSLVTAAISANIIILNNEPHILAIAKDITDRKRMEELLLKRKQQYDNLVSNIPVGVYVLHTKPDGTFANDYVSSRMAEMLGLSVESLTSRGDAIYKAIHPEDLEGFVRMNREGIQQKRAFDWKGRIVIEGAVKWLYITSLPQEIEEGEIIWNGLVVDITEQVRAKAEIELQNENLRRINSEKDKFFSIIAHDLRSPFNGFLGLTQIMAEDLPSFTMAEVQKIATKMSKSAANLYRLLTNLLEWSKIQRGAIQFNPEVILLNLVVGGSTELLQEDASRKKIELETLIPEDMFVFADVNMLQTVLRNLLSNALKFTPQGGKITISAKAKEGHQVEIAIQDNGIGMDQTLAANLFHLDVKTAREGTEGEPSTGLGLLLCKEFVERNGGKLWFESKAGSGSTFYFSMPGPA